jgi:hypothetical protein
LKAHKLLSASDRYWPDSRPLHSVAKRPGFPSVTIADFAEIRRRSHRAQLMTAFDETV